MNKNFLIIDCTGKNDSIALKTNNKFFIKKLQTNLVKNEILTLEIVNETGFDILIPQVTPKNYKNSYYSFAAYFNGEKYGIKWQEFRSKYIEFGGDGIYAAWQLVYNEPCFKNSKIGWGRAPIAENLQTNMMQFTCNQANQSEIEEQMECLRKTLNYFKKLC